MGLFEDRLHNWREARIETVKDGQRNQLVWDWLGSKTGRVCNLAEELRETWVCVQRTFQGLKPESFNLDCFGTTEVLP